jgi:NAD(P)-dependent dehydrogenase (short-subunit alcohol dehydrogenase family)
MSNNKTIRWLDKTRAMEKVALVTGSSSGIGFETSLALSREGYFTYATMRDLKKANVIEKITKDEGLPLKVIELDVDNENSVEDAIRTIIGEKQRIDVLVNNAGWGIWGTAEDVSLEEFREQFETNFFSVVRMIQKVAPIMRKQSSGNIVNISSIAGRIGFPVSTAYISSKFALEGLSESLRFELGEFGVNVIIIEPGVIKTNFFDSMKMAKKADESDAYRDITLKVVSGVKMMAEMGTPPKEVASVIINSIKEEKPLPRYVVGNDAVMFLEAKKMKTDIEFENYLKKELYGE